MNQETRILILEDVPTDAELAERELRKAQIVFTSLRVDTREDFIREIQEFSPDIILSDYNLPQFTALEALRWMKEHDVDIPFILITGSLTEEVAVECMREGANDYILKSSLKRLPSALTNALKKANAEHEKERALEALRRSEELYRLIAENTSDLISMVDMQGNYVYVSPSHRKIGGYSPESLLGRNSLSLVHPEDREKVREKFLHSLDHREGFTTEYRSRHQNGQWRIFEAVVNWIYDWKGVPKRAVIVSRDVTERTEAEEALHKSEEQLRQSQKLEAVGRLAGGIAHDFNNLITVIKGYSELLLKRLGKGDPSRQKVEEIKKAGDRAASLTQQLLAFSRKQVLQPVVLNLNAVIADMGKMLRSWIGEDIDLRIITDPALENVVADFGQLQQVVMNLAINARDAMPGGGKLTIETKNVYLDEAYARRYISVQPGHYVMLAVSDTGCGMDVETQSHIFEPFFTTKEKGKGTGLGLSTVYGIVKQSGGNIWVYSEVGRGTTFKIYLPMVRDKAGVIQPDAASIEPSRGTETVLLVEDEAAVRKLVVSVLELNGYKVLEATNGTEAVEVARSHDGPISLMITDVVMPQVGGPELAARLALLRPEMRVLYMSGYTDDSLAHHGVLDPDVAFLEKPFTPDSLARKVREVLDSSRDREDSGAGSYVKDIEWPDDSKIETPVGG